MCKPYFPRSSEDDQGDGFVNCSYLLSLFSFLAIKKNHKESSKEKKEKTCNCFLCSDEHKIKWMLQAEPALLRSLSLPSATRLRHVVVRIITSTVQPQAAIGRERDSA